jgi:hypothetical protein
MREDDTSGVFYGRHRAGPRDDYRSGPVAIAFGAVAVVVLAVCFAYVVGIAAGMRLWPL